jgi:glycosyltransferase involved in cell wall biosynthesis
MKIRHVVRGRCNPDNADGIIRHTYHLAHAQLRLGHDVEVYGIASRAPEPETIDRDGLLVRAFPPTRSPFGVHAALKARIDGPDQDVDMVHLQPPHDPAVWGLGRFLSKRGIPYFLSPHAMWAEEALSRHALRKRVYKLLLDNRLTRHSAGIHATAEPESADIGAYAPWSRVFVVRNSVDLDTIPRKGEGDDYWRSRLPIPDGGRVFVYLGRLDPYQKGLDLLLSGLAAARADGANAVLGLIGPHWRDSEKEIRDTIDRLGLGSEVVMTGALFGDEKLEALRSGDVYIQVSRYEGSPYSIIEALASGLPAIVTPGTNFADAVRVHNAGWAVEPHESSITAAISTATQCSDLQLAEMGAGARALVEHRHSLTRGAGQMVEAYRTAIAGEAFQNDD